MTFSFHSSNDFTLHLSARAPLNTVKSIELSVPHFKGVKQTLLALYDYRDAPGSNCVIIGHALFNVKGLPNELASTIIYYKHVQTRILAHFHAPVAIKRHWPI